MPPTYAFACTWSPDPDNNHNNNSSQLFDLCFNGGTCDPTSNFTSCICPSNYAHDFMLFHDPNCALPKGVYMYLFIASTIVHSPIMIIMLLMLYRPGVATVRHERTMLKWMITSIAGIWIFCLSTYVGKGCYEISLLGMSLALTSFAMCVDCFIRYLFISLYLNLFDGRKQVQEFQTNLRRILYFLWVLSISFTLGTVSTVRLYPILYNEIVSGAMFFVAAVNFAYSAIIVFNTHVMHQQLARLKHTVAELPNDTEMKETYERWVVFEKKLSHVTHVSLAYGIMFLLGPLPLPVIHYYFQSVPYQWAYAIVALAWHALSFLTLLQLLLHKTLTKNELLNKRAMQDETDLRGGVVGEQKLDRGLVSPMRALFGKRTASNVPQTKSGLHTSFHKSKDNLSGWSSRDDNASSPPPPGRNLKSVTISHVPLFSNDDDDD